MNNFISKKKKLMVKCVKFWEGKLEISYHKHTLKVATASDAISKFGS